MTFILRHGSAATMNTLVVLIFAGVFLSEAVLTIALKDFRRFFILQDFRVPDNNSMLTGIRGDELGCFFECEKIPTCIAISFHTGSKICGLLESGPTPLCPIAATGWTFYYTDSKYVYHFFNAVAYQKSTSYGGTAERAIDGNTNPDMYHGSCTHTDWFTPWWMVDLFLQFRVERVIMWNRLDSTCHEPCYVRLRDLTITVSQTQSGVDDPDNVCATYPGPPSSTSDNPVVLNCSQAMLGRYIKIQKNIDDILSVCEVDFA